jgi:hypothetical protein
MNLTLYNNILHGNLQPFNKQTAVNYIEISHLLNNCPEHLLELESRLTQVLGKGFQIDFNANTPVNINQFLSNPHYTPVVIYHFPPEVSIQLPVAQSSMQRYYYFIISAEAKRIKLRLLQSVAVLQDDICARQEIKDVLSQLARHAKTIKEEAQSNEIIEFLQLNIVKLYFEITIMFDVLLSEQDYISFVDFYSIRLNQQIDETTNAAYQKALHVHQAQRLFETFDILQAEKIIQLLFVDLSKQPTDNTIIAVLGGLENAIFLQAENADIPTFSQSIDVDFVKSVLKEKKQTFNNQLNTLSNPREALILIENAIDNLPVFNLSVSKMTVLISLSFARQFSNWLAEQKEIYKNNASQVFIPTNQNEGMKTPKPKATQPKVNPQKQKSTAQKLIAFLSGYNRKNEKIMRNEEFVRLTNYIYSLIDTGTIPSNIQAISQTGTSNENLRYTFYLIHKELYTTRPIRPEWIDLLHSVFVQFKDVEVETIRKKFATKPLYYNDDVKGGGKQEK